jgi:hypothetical protein
MAAIATERRFHGTYDQVDLAYNLGFGGEQNIWRSYLIQERSLAYDFFLHQHPYAEELVRRLLEGSVDGLQAADTDYVPGQTLPDGSPRPVLYDDAFFDAYAPDPVVKTKPVRDLDFSTYGAYAEYNWELFFHVPLTVAMHLSSNGRYEDAQKWFHFIFDPTDDSDGPTPARFWKVRPFQTTDVELIETILVNLSTGADPQLQADTIASIDAWRKAPFQPHVVARYRTSSYMFKTVMAYLDNLIWWGDSLFRQDSREAINEATMLYILAAEILGPRPQEVPNKGRMRPQTYATLKSDLNAFSDALVQLETDIPFELVPMTGGGGSGGSNGSNGAQTVASLGQALYFGVPRNDQLLGYWDTVADRLFKIRNSLNILGIFRQLPLFDPPIDPALLARAAAAGLDVAAIVSGANQPLPLVRFNLLIQKATEMAQQVTALGAELLAALEKEDGEALQILRAKHERSMLELAEGVRYAQWQEAIKAREGIETSMSNALERYTYYERQLGKGASDVTMPDAGTIDKGSLLDTMRFNATEPEIALRDIQYDIVQAIQGLPGAFVMSSWEVAELVGIVAANLGQAGASVLDGVAALLSIIPQVELRATPLGVGGGGDFGGEQISKAVSFGADVTRGAATLLTGLATVSEKMGAFSRRQQDWAYQSNLAAGEITQLYKQLRAAQIREAVAEREWHNHQQQIQNAKDIETFLTDPRTGKTTNKDFYSWMKREVKGLYSRCFEFAFDVGRKAERRMQQELGDPTLSFLQFNYMAGNEGLLAGEKLLLDVKRMEMAYHDLNRREYELTKHVSLLELAPDALLQLRQTGSCTFVLPEEVYDLDGPGHYFRRIKSVSLTIPSVAGPYTGVNATLTQLWSTIRLNSQLGPSTGDYPREGTDDPRFSDHFGSLDSVVTSSAQNDGGIFEAHDERSLPWEYTGAVSQWQLQLPNDVRQFDYDTIPDVVIHVRYTAREGGSVLKKKASDNLQSQIAAAQTLGSVRLFSIRHEFPSEWARFKAVVINGGNPTAPLSITLRPEHYPFWSIGRIAAIHSFEILARTAKNVVTVTDANANSDQLVRDRFLGDLRDGELHNIPVPPPTGDLTLNFDDNTMDELWFAVAWGG